MKKFRWGILGCAEIVSRAMIRGIQESQSGELAGIASRDLTKANAWSQEYGIPAAFGSYEALLASSDIDAVYIPLPNHLHRKWTIRAAETGKHVLCEKPIALNAAEAREMADACAKAGVRLAEAFMYRHHPRYQMLQRIVESGEIGAIRGLHGTFTYNGAHRKDNVRFHQSMGGGSIYDIGCYPISAARMILGTEPLAATAHAFFSPDHDGVDMMASGLLEFPGGVALTFDCGMWAFMRNTLEIVGTEGRIEFLSAFNSKGDPASNFFVMAKGKGRREIAVPVVNQYALQVDDFAENVRKGTPFLFEPEDAVNNMRVIDACLRSAREHIRVSIQE